MRLIILSILLLSAACFAQEQVNPAHTPPINIDWDWSLQAWTMNPSSSATIDFSSAASVTLGDLIGGDITVDSIVGGDSALDITSPVATGGGVGGGISLTSGQGEQGQRGGSLSMAAGRGDAAANGGATTLKGGQAGTGAALSGGSVTITGGSGTLADNGKGGAVITAGGQGKGTGDAGDVTFTGGTSGVSSEGGSIIFQGGDSAGASGTAGDVTIDAGDPNGGTAAGITIAGTDATTVAIGNTGSKTTLTGPLYAAKQTLDMADAQVVLTRVAGAPTGTLVVSHVMFVDANSSTSEDLLLPPEADCDGLEIIVINTGAELINVENDAGGSIISVTADEIGHFYCNGTTWFYDIGVH